MANRNEVTNMVRLSNYQVFTMMIGSTAAFGHFVYVHLVIDRAGRDGWISLLISAAIGALIIWLHMSLSKRHQGESLAEFTLRTYGKYAGRVVVLIYTLFFLLVTALTIKIVCGFLNLVYPLTPPGIFIFCEVAIASWAALLGKEVIGRTLELLLPAMMLLGIMAMALSMQDKDITELFPVMDHGWGAVWNGSLIFIVMFAELVVFGTFAGNANAPEKLPRHGLLVTAILTVMFIAPVTGPVMVFGESLAQRLAYPTFTEIQYIQIRDIIERFDIIGILLWTIGSFFRIVVFLYGTVSGMSVLLGAKNRKLYMIPAALIIGTVSLAFMQSSREEVYHFLGDTYVPIALTVGIGLPLITLGVAVAKSKFAGRRGARGRANKLTR